MSRFILGLTIALLLAVNPAGAENHALILTISNYQGGVPPLKGVAHDSQSARAIASRLGVPERNMTTLRDGELNLAGFRRAFDQLYGRVQPNDQVFVYYSGHGSRGLVRDPEERCGEALVSVNGEFFMDTEVEAKLRKLSEKARKLIVFMDACHSGGITTRAVGKDAQFVPKFWAKSGGEGQCEKPVNRLTRSIKVAAKQPGSGANNFVYIAAARDNEVSLDMPGKGGVATQSWLECLAGAAQDLDGSGGITAEEIRQCAQGKINRLLQNAQGFTPHHVSITGNDQAVLTFATPAAPVSPQTAAAPMKPAPGPVAAAAAKPESAPAAAVEPAKPAAPPSNPALATLDNIYHGRDDRHVVTLTTARPAFRINKDPVEFSVTSSHGGHVYLLMVGSDGKTFDMLFPNKLDRNNLIRAGETLRLPRPNWQIVAQGPAGRNRLLALVADAPRDFSGLPLQSAGPFSILAATGALAKDIILVTGTSSFASSGECTDTSGTKRTLVVQQRCSNAYGAAMALLEEVE
jgi:hypothetical protein